MVLDHHTDPYFLFPYFLLYIFHWLLDFTFSATSIESSQFNRCCKEVKKRFETLKTCEIPSKEGAPRVL